MSSPARSPAQGGAVAAAIIVVYVVAGVVFLLRLFGGEFGFSSEIWGALALGIVVSVPASLALLARNGRTSLLLPAAVIAVLCSPIASILMVFLVIAAAIWAWAFARTVRKGSIPRMLAALAVVPALWVASASALFVHLDPVCQETLSQGTTRRVDDVNAFTGWIWDAPSTQSGVSVVEIGVVQVVCTSDEITPLEAVAVTLFAAGAIATGMVLVQSDDDDQPETTG